MLGSNPLYRVVVLLIVCVCAVNVAAQTYTRHLQESSANGATVTVHESAYIDTIVNQKINVDDEVRAEREAAKKEAAAAKPKPVPKVKEKADEETTDEDTAAEPDTSKKVYRNGYKTSGFRVQVFAGSNSREDKAKAETIGNEIKRLFPDEPVYVHFYSPRWICRMGNYRTYEEAQSILTRVKAAGYREANIVKGTITVTN